MAKEKSIRVSTIKTLFLLRISELKQEAVAHHESGNLDAGVCVGQRVSEAYNLASVLGIDLSKAR